MYMYEAGVPRLPRPVLPLLLSSIRSDTSGIHVKV